MTLPSFGLARYDRFRPMTRYSTILASTDFSETAGIGVRLAARLAQDVAAERLEIVHVVNTALARELTAYSVSDTAVAKAHAEVQAAAQKRLDQLSTELAQGARLHTSVRFGIPAQEIVGRADECGAKLVVVSSHGRGAVGRIVLGSVASDVVRASHCPILVAGKGREGQRPFKTILAAVDLSSVSSSVIGHAVDMARIHGGHVYVVSIFEKPLVALGEDDVLPAYVTTEMESELAGRRRAAVEQLIRRHETHGVKIDLEVTSKVPPAKVVLELGDMLEPDLIVVGTSGHNAWHRMILGSTATKVLSEARSPVLVVPHGERTPSA